MCAETDEVLVGLLRPGNAGANTAADHVVSLADSAGASRWLAEECVDRNNGFSIGYEIDGRVRDGVACVPAGCWHPAVEADGTRGDGADGADVVELTALVNLDGWLTGTWLIVRREHLHPGPQLSLFDTIEGMRHTAFITSQRGADNAALELQQRQRARAETLICDAKRPG
jgi:hypothetical protein